MQGRPALVVLPVHVGSVLHQELHHVEVLVNAGLQREAVVQAAARAALRRADRGKARPVWSDSGSNVTESETLATRSRVPHGPHGDEAAPPMRSAEHPGKPQAVCHLPQTRHGETQTRPESRVQATGPAPAHAELHRPPGGRVFPLPDRQRWLREGLRSLRHQQETILHINPFPLRGSCPLASL